MVEVLATEPLADGDIRFGSLEPTTTDAVEGVATAAADDGVLLEEITRENCPAELGAVPANRFLAAAGREARAFPVAAASTADAVTGFPPTRFEVTNMFLLPALAALAAAAEALLEISIDAARLPEATTDERVGAVVVAPVIEVICCTGAAD